MSPDIGPTSLGDTQQSHSQQLPETDAEKDQCGGSRFMHLGGAYLAQQVEHLSDRLKGFHAELRDVVARQAETHRHMAEFRGLLQGLQEETFAHSCAIQRGQKTVAMRAKHALHTALAVQNHVEQSDASNACLDELRVPGGSWAVEIEKQVQSRFDEHSRWLQELSDEVAGLVGGTGKKAEWNSMARNTAGGRDLAVNARLCDLERSQKAVTVSAKRALHTAMVLHESQKAQGLPASAASMGKVDDIEQRLQQLEVLLGESPSRMPSSTPSLKGKRDSFFSRVLGSGTGHGGVNGMASSAANNGKVATSSAAEGGTCVDVTQRVEELEAGLTRLANACANMSDDLKRKDVLRKAERFEELEANLLSLAASQSHMHVDAGNGYDGRVFTLELQNHESRLERSLTKVLQQCSDLYKFQDEQRLALGQLSVQVPEVSNKLDQLWDQCQHTFATVKRHDVHVGVLRTSFEGYKNAMLEIAGDLDRHNSQDLADALRTLASLRPPAPPDATLRQEAKDLAAEPQRASSRGGGSARGGKSAIVVTQGAPAMPSPFSMGAKAAPLSSARSAPPTTTVVATHVSSVGLPAAAVGSAPSKSELNVSTSSRTVSSSPGRPLRKDPPRSWPPQPGSVDEVGKTVVVVTAAD